MTDVVLITGSSSQTGKLLVDKLSSKGFKVYTLSRKEGSFNNSSSNIKNAFIDLSDKDSIDSAVKKIIEREGKIDILVNLAGVTSASSFADTKYLDMKNMINVNLLGTFYLTKLVVNSMIKRKKGKIINITSMAGLVSFPGYGAYSASKHALEAIGMALRYETASYGINVTNIAPGAVKDSAKKKNPRRESAREKFLVLKLIMPMVTRDKVVKQIIKVINTPHSPGRVLLGADTKIVYWLSRFLPFNIWDRLMLFVWQRK